MIAEIVFDRLEQSVAEHVALSKVPCSSAAPLAAEHRHTLLDRCLGIISIAQNLLETLSSAAPPPSQPASSSSTTMLATIAPTLIPAHFEPRLYWLWANVEFAKGNIKRAEALWLQCHELMQAAYADDTDATIDLPYWYVLAPGRSTVTNL
jgi:hypothetical protein